MKRIFGLLLVSQLALADATLIMTTEASNDENEINIKNGELRFVIRSDGKVKRLSLYSQKDEKIIIINHQNNSFFVLDGQTMQMQKAFKRQQLNAVSKRLKQNMHKMSPVQQLNAQQLIRQAEHKSAVQNQPIIEFEATGEIKKVSSYNCEKIEVYVDKELSKELCIADAESLKMDLDDYSTLKTFFLLLKTINGQSDSVGIPNLKGIPIATNDVTGGKNSGLRSISYKKLKDDLFKVPANYRQVYLRRY